MTEKEPMTEEKLLLLLKEGDHRAFTSLYNLYWKRVFNFCRLYVPNDTALEILQDVFVKLWTNRELIDEKMNFEGYLFIITRNLVFDENRKKMNETYRLMSLISALEQSYDETEEEICTADLQNHINRLIEELPPQCKRIFNMSRKQNLTNPEISERLNISIKTVEAAITRALKYLKQNIYSIFLSILCVYYSN